MSSCPPSWANMYGSMPSWPLILREAYPPGPPSSTMMVQHSMEPPKPAWCKGMWPLMSFTFGSAPRCMRTRVVATSHAFAAYCSALAPSLSPELISSCAPASRTRMQHSAEPPSAAMWSDCAPSSLRASTLAPLTMSACTQSTFPTLHAKCSGRLPTLSIAFTSLCRSMSVSVA
jgi:hypothetical protein